MALGNVVQRGSTLYVYDEKGRQLSTIPVGNGLKGYTSSTVSVLRSNTIYMYDEKGRQTGTTPAR